MSINAVQGLTDVLAPGPVVPAPAQRFRLWRDDIDAALDRWLPGPPACPPCLATAMRYAIGTGGKRFRPLLCLATADAVAAARGVPIDERAPVLQRALPVACAVELVHTQSLVHDDLPAMDDDAVRRGQPTVHVRFGEGLAILVGDGLLAEAFGLLARQPATDDPQLVGRKLRVIATLGDAIGAAGMAGGQALDLAGECGRGSSGDVESALAAITDIHRRKTGGLICAAAVSGAVMADASDAALDVLCSFASDLGLTFQIVDDVLDVTGNAAVLGKTACKDARAGKVTFATLLGADGAMRHAEAVVESAVARLDAAGLASPELRALATVVLRRCA